MWKRINKQESISIHSWWWHTPLLQSASFAILGSYQSVYMYICKYDNCILYM